MPLDKLQLSPRTANCLKRAHLTKVGEVVDLSDEDLLKIRNFGERSLLELKEKLSELNIPSGLDQDEDESGPQENSRISNITHGDISELMGNIEVQPPQSDIEESSQLSEFIPEMSDDLDEEEE